VLYLDLHWDHFEDCWSPGLLSGCPWDIGQFHPEDLKRARKLALRRSGHLLVIQNSDSESAIADISELSGALRLFSRITELLLVEWSKEDVGQWSEFFAKTFVSYLWPRRTTEQDAVDTPHELLSCIAVEEIDALLSLITAQEKYRTELSSAGNGAGALKAHKQQNGSTVPYFQDRQLQLEQLFLEQRDAMVSASNDSSVAPWEIPRIKAVHVLPSSMASFLSHE